MSKIEVGQVWKNHLDAELTITEPGHHRLAVLSDDIWLAHTGPSTFFGKVYAVTEKSLADCGYTLKEEA